MSKKRKRLMGIIGVVICILLVGIGITIICVAKYKEEHRYLTYAELEPEQIVLIKETIEIVDDKKYVFIRAVDAEGDTYFSEIPYEEWNGVELFFTDVKNGEKKINEIYDEDMEQIYKYIVLIDKEAEYKCITMTYINPVPRSLTSRYCYGIRYRMDGTIEYVKFWEEKMGEKEFLLDDPAAKEVDNLLGPFL